MGSLFDGDQSLDFESLFNLFHNKIESDDIKLQKRDEQRIKKNKDLFFQTIWDKFGRANIDKFGEKYISEVDEKAKSINSNENNKWLNHLIQLILVFKQEQICKYVDFIRNQSILLNE